MNFIRVWVFNFLSPLFMPMLDECNKRNLKKYYENQEAFQFRSDNNQSNLNEFMQKNLKKLDLDLKLSEANALTMGRIADALERMSKPPPGTSV